MKALNFRVGGLAIAFRRAATAASGLALIATSALAENEYLSEAALIEAELEGEAVVSDPIEPVNRAIFAFNDFVYLNLIDPLAKGYTAITPDPVERGAENFFRNLGYPVRLAGNLLQGRFEGAWVETGRFAINTTLGLGGVMRPADSMEGFAPIPSEDLGQAFGSWGWAEGPYLVLPLLGPSNLRDLVGYVGDRAVQPLDEPFSLIDDWDWEWRLALTASEITVESPSILARYRQMREGAIDPYGSMKNAYTQNRRAAVER